MLVKRVYTLRIKDKLGICVLCSGDAYPFFHLNHMDHYPPGRMHSEKAKRENVVRTD
jgi:hypothetical protein